MLTPVLIHLLNNEKNMEKLGCWRAGPVSTYYRTAVEINVIVTRALLFFFFSHFTFSSPLQLKTLEDINIPPQG